MEKQQKTGKWLKLLIDILKVLAGFLAGSQL